MTRLVIGLAVAFLVGIIAFTIMRKPEKISEVSANNETSNVAQLPKVHTLNKSQRLRREVSIRNQSTHVQDSAALSEPGAAIDTQSTVTALEESAPESPGPKRLINVRALAVPASGQFLVEPRVGKSGRIFATDAHTGKTYEITGDGKLLEVTDFADVPMPVGVDAGEDPEGRSWRSTATPGSRPDEELEQDVNAVAAFVRDGQAYIRTKQGETPRPVSGGEDRYNRALLSPDGKLVALESPHTGVHLTDAETFATVADLGDGVAARWIPGKSALIYRWSQMDEMGKVALGDVYYADAAGNWQVSNLTQSIHTVERDPVPGPDGNSILYSVDGAIYLGQIQ